MYIDYYQLTFFLTCYHRKNMHKIVTYVYRAINECHCLLLHQCFFIKHKAEF
jgi:hypothetical protein